MGVSSRGPGSYPEGYTKVQYREPMAAPVASDSAHQPSIPSPSSLKYECDYCGKGFTRPSSLKVCITLRRPDVSYPEYDC